VVEDNKEYDVGEHGKHSLKPLLHEPIHHFMQIKEKCK